MALGQAEEESRLFNSREALFDKPMTQYTALKDVNKLFEPYYDLWTSVDDWTRWEKAWLNDSFLTLDAEDIDKKANVLFRSHTGGFYRGLEANIARAMVLNGYDTRVYMYMCIHPLTLVDTHTRARVHNRKLKLTRPLTLPRISRTKMSYPCTNELP